jgi:hypothetical protein
LISVNPNRFWEAFFRDLSVDRSPPIVSTTTLQALHSQPNDLASLRVSPAVVSLLESNFCSSRLMVMEQGRYISTVFWITILRLVVSY